MISEEPVDALRNDDLVEANGDILLVRKRVDTMWPVYESLRDIGDELVGYIYDHCTPQYRKSISFDVFKISLDHEYTGCTPCSVSRVKSLDDGVIFLAATGSFMQPDPRMLNIHHKLERQIAFILPRIIPTGIRGMIRESPAKPVFMI